jgi:molybdenum cofactor cytidylyltransferase
MFVALLLAAGQGRRFREAGGNAWKLLAEIAPSRTVLRQSCENLLAAGWPVKVVTGAFDEEIRQALAGLNVKFVRNTDPDAGLGSSIACGVAVTPDADGWLVALGDMPFIRRDTVARVAASLQAGAAITFPVCDGKRGHPVGFSRRFASQLASLAGDTGAQSILAPNRELWVPVEVEDEGILRDVDVPGDLPAA